jgi:hypothetical protein
VRRLGARRLALLAVVASAVASASVAFALVGRGSGQAASAGPSCPLVVTFRSTDYYATTVKETLTVGRPLGRAVVEPCGDSVLNPQPPAAPNGGEVAAVAGVPPSVAVGVAGRPHTAYLAFGYFPELPGYPLHEAKVRSTKGCRMTGRFTLAGTARLHAPLLLVQVLRGSGSLGARPGGVTFVELQVDTRTRVEGFDRNGLPYVTADDRLRAAGVICEVRGALSPALVARTIAPRT